MLCICVKTWAGYWVKCPRLHHHGPLAGSAGRHALNAVALHVTVPSLASYLVCLAVACLPSCIFHSTSRVAYLAEPNWTANPERSILSSIGKSHPFSPAEHQAFNRPSEAMLPTASRAGGAGSRSPPRKRARQSPRSKCCAKCRSFMSIRGIAHAHNGRFRHLARGHAERQAEAGCQLCRFLCNHADGLLWHGDVVLILAAGVTAEENRRRARRGNRLGVVRGSVEVDDGEEPVITFVPFASSSKPQDSRPRR